MLPALGIGATIVVAVLTIVGKAIAQQRERRFKAAERLRPLQEPTLATLYELELTLDSPLQMGGATVSRLVRDLNANYHDSRGALLAERRGQKAVREWVNLHGQLNLYVASIAAHESAENARPRDDAACRIRGQERVTSRRRCLTDVRNVSKLIRNVP